MNALQHLSNILKDKSEWHTISPHNLAFYIDKALDMEKQDELKGKIEHPADNEEKLDINIKPYSKQ